MTLFVLAILSLLGLGLITSSSLETRINSNSRSAYPAYYAAEAGLEEATYRLNGTAVNPINLAFLDSPSKVVYLRQSAGIDPTNSSAAYYDNEFAGSNFTTINYIPSNQTSNPIPYQWVKISMKTKRLSGQDVDNTGLTTNPDAPVYFDGAQYLPVNFPLKMGFPVYQVTSFSMTPEGATCKVRREIASAAFLGLPGALFLNGPTPVFSGSTPFSVIGLDSAGGADRHAVGVLSATDVPTVISELPPGGLYMGLGSLPLPPPYPPPPPPPPDVWDSSLMNPTMYTTPQGLEGMLNQIASNASATYPPGTTTCSGANCWGTPMNPVINVFDGDCDFGGNSGAGVLVVRGNLQMLGSGSFDGLILVVGQGVMTVTSNGSGSINGGVFVAKTRDLSGNQLPNLGVPNVTWAGGPNIQYNSFNINRIFVNSGYLKLAYKELPF